MQPLKSISLRSYGKINWYLRVLNKRNDGYHNIESLMQRISLYDEIVIDKGEELSLQVDPDMGIPIHENLIYRAAKGLMEYSGFRGGARIRLKKNVPFGAGLGGGSSNAAFTLMGLNELWQISLTKTELSRIALNVGSDVPFFLGNSPSIVQGRGEILKEAKVSAKFPLLIVKPKRSISTKEAYRILNRGAEAVLTSNITGFIEALQQRDFRQMMLLGVNDFEEVVFRSHPEIAKIKETLLSSGALYSLMSGSGSALYGIFDSRERAEGAAERFRECYCYVTETI